MTRRRGQDGWLKHAVRYPLEALLVYALYGFFRLLPLETASALGGWIGRNLGPRLGATRKARRNLSRAMPELSQSEQDLILRGMWDNLGRVMAEYPHLDAFDSSRVTVEGADYLKELVQTGRSALVISGHLANWEVIPVTAAKHGFHLQLVYRHANNPYVERLLARARAPTGGRLARKGLEGARSVHTALKNGRSVGMLVDQKHNKGRAIPFFGRPAMTAPAVAVLALHHHVPILMVDSERLPGARFRLTVHPPLAMPDPALSHDAAVTAILTTINATLENWIRAKPAQWLWLHRRWPD